MEGRRILIVIAAVCSLILLFCIGLTGYSLIRNSSYVEKEELDENEESESNSYALLYRIVENVYYENVESHLKETENEETDTYIVCMEDQTAKPEKVKYRFAEDRDHMVICIDQENNVISEKTVGSGEFTDEVSEETYMILFTVYEADKYFSVSGEGNYQPPDTPVTGQYFSVLGDSASAYAEYTTASQLSFYQPEQLNVQDMWWAVLAEKTGMIPCTINAIGGTGVTELLDIGYPTAGNSERCEQLDADGVCPDVIFVLLGGNDMRQGINQDTFYHEYLEMLERIKETYSESEIYVCTYYELPGPYAESGQELNELIKKAAAEAEVDCIDSEKCGIGEENPEDYFLDYDEESQTGIHVNRTGQIMFGEYIAEEFLAGKEGED